MNNSKFLIAAALILGSLLIAYMAKLSWNDAPKKSPELTSVILQPREGVTENVFPGAKPDEFDQLIRDTSEFMAEANVNDPGMQDGGKIHAVIGWMHGPIIDIGDPSDLTKNRLSVSTSADGILFEIFDSEGKHHQLQSAFDKFDEISSLELLWSPRDQFLSITVDQQILAKKRTPAFSIFQDTNTDRQMIVGSNFWETSGHGGIRGVTVYSNRQISAATNFEETSAYGSIQDVNVYANRPKSASSKFEDVSGYGSIRSVSVFASKER